MKKRYRTSDGGVYEISDAEVNDFMTDFPDAIEVETYEADGEEYDISADEVSAFMTDFPSAVKKKEVSGQGSDPLTQSLPVKTIPAKVAPKGQPIAAKPASKKQAAVMAQGDPLAVQKAPASINYDPTIVRDSIKGVKEGLDKTYRIAQEGKRKGLFDSWNTQQAYSYIKPSVDYTEMMLGKIKDIQDPEIQALYNDLNNANTQMKDMVGKAWNDGWDESSVNQYIGGLSRDISNKIDQIDRRMAELQKPTPQQQKAQELFEKTPIPKKQYTKEQKQLLEPEETEAEKQAKQELESLPPSTMRVLTDEEAENLTLEQRRMSSDEFWQRYVDEMSVKPELAKTMEDYTREMALWASGVGRGEKPWEDRKAAVTEEGKVVGYEPTKEEKDYREKLGEVDQNIATVKMGEYYEANMGKRHENIDFAKSQDNLTKLYDAYIAARSEDPESEETKTLAKDVRVSQSELNKAYRAIELDYLESTSAKQPTLTKENIDRYNKTIAKVDAGEELSDTEAQFLFNTRRAAIDAFSTINNAKVLKLRSKSNVAGYTKGMAELTPLMEEVLGDKSIVQFASEQLGKQAKAAMAPIQEEYGKKRRELAEYETQLANIDGQIEQLEADYQSGAKTQQQYEDELNQLDVFRKDVYGSYEVAYSALEQLNKAMETAIAPFNTEMSKISDPYNKKIQQLNDEITKLKNQTGVDDSVLAELDILYKNLGIAKQAAQITNAQFNEQYNREELNKWVQEDRKRGGNIVAEFGRGVVSGVAQIGYGLMQLPKAVGVEDADEFGFIDEMYNFSRQLQYESSGSWGALQGEGVPSYLRTAYSVGNGVSSSLTYAAGGMLAGPATLPSVLTSVATTYLLSAGDNYQRAIDSGMDSRTANAFSTIMTGLQAGAELIYKDVKILDDAIGNTVITNITKNGLSVSQAFKVALKNAPENLKRATTGILWENFEEGTSLFVEKLAPPVVNAVAGQDYIEDNITAKDFEDTFISTSGSTFITRLLFRRSRLDPNSRMALFKSVQNGQKAIEQAERIGLDGKKIAQMKKDYEDAKLKLSVVESHSNWARMNDDQKAYAFDLARQLDELEKAKKQGEKIGVKDDSLNEQVEQTKADLNEALNNPQATQDQEQIKSNTLEVLEAVKNGEDYPQMLSTHPNWNKLSDQQKKEIESLSEDLEEKQREILSLFEVGVESSTTIEQRNTIEGKISEILNNPTNDQKDIEGVSGEVREGQEPVQAEPVAGEGEGEAEAGGILQTPEEEVTPTTEAAPEVTPELNPEIAKIEEKRAAELEAFENDENLTEIDGEQVLLTPDGRITRDTINEKYDKQVDFQKEIETAIADVKKQQDPAYQEALRQAIDADPKASNQVHQIAAENILNGANATDAIASATQQAAQQARTEKARQAMEREGLVSSDSDIQKSIENVTRALRSTGIRVNLIKDPAKFEEARKEAKASETAEGWFRSKTGEIVLSEKALKEGWGTTIVFHEGTHPILNIIRNTDKKLYDRAVKGLRDAAKKEKIDGKPNPLKDVEAWVAKAAGKKTQEQQDDEFMTETIARLASGEIEIKMLPRTVKEKFIDALNKIAKFMGFKRVFFNSPDTEFRRLANQIATTLAKGEKIEKIVGKRNVKKYQAKFVQPRAIELLMGKENLSKYGLEPGKKYNVRQIYEAFEKRQKDLFGQIDRKDYSEKTMKQLAEWAKDEVMFMTTEFPDESGTGWYTTKFQAALDEVAKIFPEIGTDPGQRSLFTMLVAIYSDGTKVEKNMSNAIMAFSDYRKTGVIPNTETGGERNASFNANINEINRLIAEFDGDFEAMTKYLLEEKSGSELAKEAKENGEEFKTDWPAEMILPVASRVFGPKLGMFYSNLMGKEGYPTLDRWFSRLFNRYRGDLMPRLTGLKGKEKDTKGQLQGVARFKSFIGKPGISDNKAIEAAKERALQFGSRTKLGNSDKASKMLSPIEKKLGMKQGADKASKEKFKKAAKAAGIKLTGPEFKAHEQFVKDRTGGFWTELEGKVGFKQGSKDTDKTRFDEAAAKLGYGPDSKLYKNHLADKAANTIYKAAFVALNDAPFNRTDRKFMFDTLVEARKMLKKEGVDVTVADIQAILWYYEKKLYVSQGGLESAMGISYQEAAENSVEEYNQNGGKLDTEVTQDDLIDEDGDTDLEDEFVQPSEKVGRGPKPTNAEIDTYLSEQEFFRSTSPFAWAVDAVSRETLESSSIVENEGTYAVVTEDGDIKGVFNPNVAKQREGVPARKNTLNGLIPKAIAAGGIKLDNFDGRLTELYSKNGFKKVSSVPFNEEYAPEGWVKEEHGTPDVVAMVYDPDNKLDIEFKKFDDYGDMISYRDSFVDQAREAYQNKSKGNQRIADALGIEDIIQPSETVGRGEKLVRSGEITESDRQIALYAIQNKMGIKTTNADMIRVSKMSPEQKIKLIEDAFQDRVKKMNPAFRDPEFINQPGTEANRFYQYAVDAKNRVLALVPKETIQPTEPGRYDKKDIPDLIERAVAGIDADLRKGMSLIEAIENNMTNQEWYPLLNDKQKRQVQSVLESTFDEEIASLPTEEQEAAEIGVDVETKNITSELEDLYYQIRDGRRVQANQAKARRDEILRGNPKLSYIYKNFDFLSAQLEERGLLTKSIGCP